MNKYCCFNCPKKDYTEKELWEKCPYCNMHYGFPLDNMPTKVGNFTIEKSLDRGFYGATYIATSNERLPKKRVVKIIPKKIYELFEGKNFENECRAHFALEHEHIVQIHDFFDEDVYFDENKIPCHVCILDYVNGEPLKQVMENELSVEKLTQIVIDLLEILEVFKNNNKNHNDLHPGNILVATLAAGTKRIDQIDNSIKLVVIDLNSTADQTLSSDIRIGDINWIGNCLHILCRNFISNKERKNIELTDKENRVIAHFENFGKLLMQKVISTRIPKFDDLVYDIKNTYRHVVDPHNEPFALKSFDYAYNAQTLKPNFVPALFVDPQGRFFNESIKPGPLIIYGMRGCGKTLLLLGLTFYSRISKSNTDKYSDLGISGTIDRIQNDGFIGLYINANKLLDVVGKKEEKIYKPLERIYLRFALEALRTLRTFKSIKDNTVHDFYFEKLQKEIFSKVNGIDLGDFRSDRIFEDKLIKIINILEKGEGEELTITTAATIIFEDLTDVINSCSPVLENHKVFYLLDDVSTRYLNEVNIIQIISTFIFQSSKCAFKITTEAQTLNAILFSPGNQEKTRIGRDLQTFDLGNLVNEEIRKNKNFVIDILEKRNRLLSKDNVTLPHPIYLLADTSLENIASNITKTGSNKKRKKQFYHGLTMLAKVCVGDIGDVIHIYNLMLEEYKRSAQEPLKPEIQNEVYQKVSANKIFDLDRNKNDLKDFALTFAKASYKLLMESKGTKRLRQYNSIYIKITSGDQDYQINRLRSLVDAGIFVYDGSPQAPRTTGNDTNPLLQFKLAFRKLLGLTNFIGISQADRFELSGAELEEWLKNPQDGEKILLKNKSLENDFNEDEASYSIEDIQPSKTVQSKLSFNSVDKKSNDIEIFFQNQNTIVIKKVSFSVEKISQFEQYIFGIGFEDRTYISLLKILKNRAVKRIVALKHNLKDGRYEDIKKILREAEREVIEIEIDQIAEIDFGIPTILDVSGLSKSMIFNCIIAAKRHIDNLCIIETEALELSPSDKDLNQIINSGSPATEILKEITETVELGELKPYQIENIYSTDSDESNSRVILCFSSAKFERMLSFLDNRQYDKILIINPNKNDNISKLAKISSKVIQDKYSSMEVEALYLDIHNQTEIINAMSSLYQKYYLQEGCNFDIAITGSKLQTICAGIFTCFNKINNCWYIKPNNWKASSFSSGAGETYLYLIENKD